MAKHKLCDIAPIIQGDVPQADQYWLLNLDMVESNTGRIIDYLYCSENDIGNSTVKFDTRNVLYSKLRPYLNKVVLPQKPGYATSEMLPLCPDQSIITREYLTYYLRSPSFVSFIKDKTSGAKMPRANSADLKSYILDCPSINEQQIVTHQLDSLVSIIEKRTLEVQKLDDLIKARFVEMFGDPINNTKHLPICHLGELGIWNSGGTPSRTNPEYFTGSINWYSAGELNSLYLHGSNEKITEEAIDNSATKLFKAGSMLVGMYDTAAFKMGILIEDSASNQACACIEPNNSIDIIWLYYALTLMKGSYLSQRRGVRQKNLNLGMIREFTLPIACIDEQKQFVSFVKQVNKSKSAVKESLEEAQLLFDSLMQQYFG